MVPTNGPPMRRRRPEDRTQKVERPENADLSVSGRRGSNSRPQAWEAGALPTELHPRGEQHIAPAPGRACPAAPEASALYPSLLMRRSPVPVAVIVLAVLLVGVLAYGLLGRSGGNLDTAVKRGERPLAPAAAAPLPNLGSAGSQTIASLRGKVVFVNLWASWCEPCKGEAPLISAIHDALVKSGEGQVLGVTYLDATSKSLAFAKTYRLTFPSVRDIDEQVFEGFEATGQPETYVIDRNGRVAAISRGVIKASFANEALAAVGAKARVPVTQQGARAADQGSGADDQGSSTTDQGGAS